MIKSLLIGLLISLPIYSKSQSLIYTKVDINDVGAERIDQHYSCDKIGMLSLTTDSCFIDGKGIKIHKTGKNTFKSKKYTISLTYRDGKVDKVYVRRGWRTQIFYIQNS